MMGRRPGPSDPGPGRADGSGAQPTPPEWYVNEYGKSFRDSTRVGLATAPYAGNDDPTMPIGARPRETALVIPQFVGPAGRHYQRVFSHLQARRPTLAVSWAALLVPLAWCWYRRMYVYGLVMTVIGPMLLAFSTVFWGHLVHAEIAQLAVLCGIALLWLHPALLGKIRYLRGAEPVIQAIETMGMTYRSRDAMLAEKGGTAPVAAVAGIALTVFAMLGAVDLSGRFGSLEERVDRAFSELRAFRFRDLLFRVPACSNGETLSDVEAALASEYTRRGVARSSIRVLQGRSLGPADLPARGRVPPMERYCAALASVGGSEGEAVFRVVVFATADRPPVVQVFGPIEEFRQRQFVPPALQD